MHYTLNVNPPPPVQRTHVAAMPPPPSSISSPSQIVRPTSATSTKTTQPPPPPQSSVSVTSSSSPFPPSNNSTTYVPPSALDEVMNELDDLLQAASESHALGRLRNSYSSLLLAHQRLVGLGRRVDRSYCEAERSCVEEEQQQQHDNNTDVGGGGEGSHQESNMTSMSTTTTFLPPLVNQPPLPLTLTQHGEYADVAYVEHLARSAMELHHRRTGRGMQHELAIERAAHAVKTKKMEDEQIRQAAQGVFALSSAVSPGGGGGGDGVSRTTASSTPATSSGGMKKRKGSTDGDEGVSWKEYTDGNNDGPDTPGTPSKRKGGRGKKPPTLVMQTMTGRNLDVRELMTGIL